MKLFEKIIIGLLSFSVVLLFSVAIDFPNTKAYQSPKGSFSATIVEKKGMIHIKNLATSDQTTNLY